jgi:hypothetical protein
VPESADSKRTSQPWEAIISVVPLLIILEVAVATALGVAPLFSMPELRLPAMVAVVLLLPVCVGLNLYQDLKGRPRVLTGIGVVACMLVVLVHPFVGLLGTQNSVYRTTGHVVVAHRSTWVTTDPAVTVYGAFPYTSIRHRQASSLLVLPTDLDTARKWVP